jgi:hypothetical protein
MPQYHMAGLEPPETPIELIRERYESSEQFVTDALDWMSVHVEDIAEIAMGLYVQSSAYATMLEDIADGVVEL